MSDHGHSHSHHHHHSDDHQKDLGDANRAHWDKHATTYTSKPWIQKMSQYVVDQLQLRRSLFGINTSSSSSTIKDKQPYHLLDYACGTGNVSKAFAPYITQITGVDVSPNMVKRYNEEARNHEASMMHAVAGNFLSHPAYLLKDDDESKTDDGFLSEERWNGFDGVVVGLGFHHFQDYVGCLRALRERCRVGGVVGIVDLLPNADFDKTPEELKKTMHVSGFTETQMRTFMEEAGLVDVQFVELPDQQYVEMMGSKRDVTIFFAVGKKP